MQRSWLKHGMSNLKVLTRWAWRKIKSLLQWLMHVPEGKLNRMSILFLLINTFLLVIALWLSIENAKEASRFQENVVNNLTKITELSDSLRNSLESLPGSIENFDATIRGLNSVVERQQDSLSKSIGALDESVDRFSQSLVSYEENLSQIVEATDKQIELLKKTQAMWEEEVSRRPDLYLVVDSIARISDDTVFVHFRLYNKGNKMGRTSFIILYIPTDCEFIAENWFFTTSDASYKRYSLSKVPEAPFDPSPDLVGSVSNKYFRFRLKRASGTEFPSSIEYVIFEEKIGSQTGDLKLAVPR